MVGKSVEGIKGVLVLNDVDGLEVLMEVMKMCLFGYDDDKNYEIVIVVMFVMEGSFYIWYCFVVWFF